MPTHSYVNNAFPIDFYRIHAIMIMSRCQTGFHDMPKGTKKRVSMEIEPQHLKALREYSEVSGVPMVRALRDALDHWIRDVMPARMKAFKQDGGKK